MNKWKLRNIFNWMLMKMLHIKDCGLQLKLFLDGDVLP